jgi:histidine triad (HIT) family protein
MRCAVSTISYLAFHLTRMHLPAVKNLSRLLIGLFLLFSFRGQQFFLLSSRCFNSSLVTRRPQQSTSLLLVRSMSDEVSKAQSANLSNVPTIFDKLLSKEIPSQVVYEDDRAYCFRDVNPQAPFHALVIPRQKDGLVGLSSMQEDQKGLVGHLMYVAQKVGQENCPNGFRVVVNDGRDGAQSVPHLHMHVLGGRQMGWPPG